MPTEEGKPVQLKPGWYPDPSVQGSWRWWDGESWTEHMAEGAPAEQRAARAGAGQGSPGAEGGARTEGGAELQAQGAYRRGHLHPRPARRAAPARPAGREVVLRRWAALAGVVLLLVVLLYAVLRGSAPALYWQGEPMANAGQVLLRAEAAMSAVASTDEGVVSPKSRCYFSLSGPSAHDVRPYLRCGPVLLPWSSPAAPWLTYPLSATAHGSAQKLAVAVTPPPATTAPLAHGEILRRPGGGSPPQGSGGLSVPAVPRQRPGWQGLLGAPPPGLKPAPVGTLIGGWTRSYRLVAFGEVGQLSARLDPTALGSAVVPPGSAYANRPTGARPSATLLLPTKGEVFVVAELAASPGEGSGAVPSEAGMGRLSSDQPALAVANGPDELAAARLHGGSGDVTVAAGVPIGARPVLDVVDKGLTQQVSLSNGQLLSAPSILSRPATDERLSATGRLGGADWHVSDASLVWFAGSDGGTVPPRPDEAYLEVLAKASPASASFLPVSDFSLDMPGGESLPGQVLPDADRSALLVGFVVPASFSDGTVVISVDGQSLAVPVHFP